MTLRTRLSLLAAGLVLGTGGLVFWRAGASPEPAPAAPAQLSITPPAASLAMSTAPSTNPVQPTSPTVAEAILGGGCFWCLEAVFERLKGVAEVESGYAGGGPRPITYEELCAGEGAHAEVVRIVYDPNVIGFEQLLEVFWDCHDPTTYHRQGADQGSQYRSVILARDEDQLRLARLSRDAAQTRFPEPIVTEIQLLDRYFPAEDYHQDYFRRNPHAPYCAFVIRPKLRKLFP